MLLDWFFCDEHPHRPDARARRYGRRTHRKASPSYLFLERLEERALPSFITAPRYAVEYSPYVMAVGDFNADGSLDIVTDSYPFGNVNVLLGAGDGTFQAARSFPTLGGYPGSIGVGDFNGDGALDLIVPGTASSISELIGNGDGTFQPALAVEAGPTPFAVAVADFNADGTTDLAVTNPSVSTVSILRGNGDGTFQAPVSYNTGSGPSAVAVGDFNADGALDLVFADGGTNTVSVLKGNGDASFQAPVSFTVGTHPYSVTVGDFNGDGALDLAVANPDSNNVSVLLGRGDGTFQQRVNYAVGLVPRSLTAGDFDGDGALDLAVANTGSGSVGYTHTVSILPGNGNGTFLAATTWDVGPAPKMIAAGDWDGDGDLDLAVADAGSPSDVAVLLNDGHGSFAAPRWFAAGTHPSDVALGDFNEDGVPDLAVANYHDHVASVLLGRGDSTFQPPVHYVAGTTLANSVVGGDFNRDGHQDFAVAGTRVDVFLGRGDGTFGNTFYGLGGADASDLAAADFNGDGVLDLVVTLSYQSAVAVLRGNGNGTFQAAQLFYAGDSPYSVAVGDFNHDQRIDLVVTNFLSSVDPNKVYVLLGKGDGTFQDPVPYGQGDTGRSVAVADLNADGELDLAVANEQDSTASVFLGNGDGTFQPAADFTTGPGPWSVSVGDIDRDGTLDLVLATPHGGAESVIVLPGRGDGNFGAPALYTAGVDARSVSVADLNGDGWLDLAVANWEPNSVSIVLNAPDITISDVAVVEGNSGTRSASFSVTLSAASQHTVTVAFATADGSAAAGSDYQAASGTLTFLPGETSKSVTVLVNGDRRGEVNETFYVRLSNETNAALTDRQAVGTILDDEPRLIIGDASAPEGNAGTVAFTFTVSLSSTYDAPVTVHYKTANGSAMAGSDYQAAAGTLTFTPGQTSQSVTVLVNGDRLGEANETFRVNLSAATRALIADRYGVGTIVDDEPRLTISDVRKVEGNSGTRQYVFTVRLSAAYDQPVTVSFQTVDGTATTGDNDYVAQSGTLTFNPGETTQTITIVVNGDIQQEADERFDVDLFDNSANVWLAKRRGLGTIVNDD
jgi:hypothetical protein